MPKIVVDDDVFRAALRLVTERGYAGATTREIAEAAGVSEVTLFRKYGSKAQLVREAVASIADNVDIQSAVRYTGNLSEDLLRIVQIYQGSAVRFRYFFLVLLSEAERHPELLDALNAPLTILVSVGQLLEQYQVRGDLRREHPLHAASALLAPVIYAGIVAAVAPANSIPPLDLRAHIGNYLEGRGPGGRS